MPDGDQTTCTRAFARSCNSFADIPPGKRSMSVGDRVKVWNGGQSWPGRIHAFPGDGKVVIHGNPRWTGYRATVPRSRMTRCAVLEHNYECRLTVMCNPNGVSQPTSLDPVPFTMAGVTMVTPGETVLPLSPCLDSLDWSTAPA